MSSVERVARLGEWRVLRDAVDSSLRVVEAHHMLATKTKEIPMCLNGTCVGAQEVVNCLMPVL